MTYEADAIKAERQAIVDKAGLLVHTAAHKIEKRYKTPGYAKAAVKRAKKWDGSPKYPPSDYCIMSWEEYNEKNVEVTVYNILSGKPVVLRLSEVGGPCDPSTERYHCM